MTSKNILTPQFEAGMYSTVLDGGIDTVAYNAWVEVQSYPCQPKELFESAPTWKGFTRCRQSQPDGAVTVAIIGDSHAEHLFPGLAKALPNDNVAFYIDHSGRYYRDGDRMNQIFDYLETNSSIRTIVVSVNWFQKGVETEKMISALSPLTAQGRRIFVTDDNPTFAFGSFQCKYAQGLVLPKRCTMPADEFWPTHDRYAAKLREVASSLPGIQLVDTASFFCTRDVCDMSRDGAVIFRDINHLNELGTILVGQLIVSEHPDIATPQG